MKARIFGWQTAVGLGMLLFLAACSPEESLPNATEGGEISPESVVAAPQPTQSPESPMEVLAVHLEDRGPAPEIENEIWLNTEKPLPLSSQQGKVVLLEFWTFG